MSRASLRIALVVLVAAAAGGASASLASGPAAVRRGVAPRLPAGSRVVGSLATASGVRVTVTLEPRDPAALQSYATAVSTPGTSAYRRFLSVAAFRARFGPTDAQIAAVAASLRSHGLEPGAVTSNGLAIPVTATAGAVERAFSTSLNRVQLPSGRIAYANTSAPLLDSSVAGLVQGVIGLDNVSLPHPEALRAPRARRQATKHVATGGPQPCAAASTAASANSAYTTDQIASAYGFSGLYGIGDQGAGQTVAIYELEGNFPSDISAYKSCYGITASVTYSSVDGGPPPPNPNPPAQDGLETELDIENVIGLAPKANVIVYQGPNSGSNLPGSGPYDVYNAIISQDGAQIISTSWGQCEPQDTPAPVAQQAENTLFQEAAVQGQSVFSAAGDNGSEDCTSVNGDALPGLAVDDPASQPFVTSAGGTKLTALGPPPTQSVWNDPLLSGVCSDTLGIPTACGGGGGISTMWAMPSYQSGAPAALNVVNSKSSKTPCGAPAGTFCREVPDVSANADPVTGYTIYYNGTGDPADPTGWANGTPLGGTSAAAPLWAALTADVNASPACGGSPIGFANPALYRAAGAAYASDFGDITAGNNDILGTSGGLYPAGVGYDMASGLGTPNAANLAGGLCGLTVHVRNPGNQTTISGAATSLPISATDAPGKTLTYSARGLPAGLSVNGQTGVISGMTFDAGAHAVTVYAVDNDGSVGNATFAWTVIAPGPPTVSRGSLTGVGKGKPKLTLTLTAGSNAAGISKFVVSLPRGLRFSAKKRNLSAGVSVGTGPGFKLRLSNGRLTITLRSGVRRVRVVVRAPALIASKALISNVQHKHTGKLKITLKAIDSTGHATTLSIRVKPS